jgi:hypothetical protein
LTLRTGVEFIGTLMTKKPSSMLAVSFFGDALLSNSAWAILTASANSSSGSFGLMTSWPCWARKVGLMPPGRVHD